MAALTTREARAASFAAGLLGAGGLLFELSSFRLDAAVFGWGYARLMAILLPVLGGLAGVLFGSRKGGEDLAGRGFSVAAHGALAASAASGIAAIALTWSSQRLAKLDGSLWPYLIPGLGWCGVSAGLVTSMCGLLRAARGSLGRVLWAFCIGGALAALASPAALWLGCPRTLLLVGALFAASSLAVAGAAPTAIHGPMLATVPLALLSLSLGDIRNPWLKVRTDVGRKGRVGLSAWTAEGLLQVDQGKAGILNYSVDQAGPRPLSLLDKAKRRQAFEVSDMAYFLGRSTGAALVVGVGGGREVREAFDSGHPRVDAIDSNAAFLLEFASEFGEEAGYLLQKPDDFTLRFGEVGSQLPKLRERYGRIVVAGDAALEVLPTRFVSDSVRALSVESLRLYLQRLAAPDGVLLVRVEKTRLPDLLSTVGAALGTPSDEASEPFGGRVIGCAERRDDGAAAVLVAAQKLSGPDRSKVTKACKRKGLTVEFPPTVARNGDRSRGAAPKDAAAASGAVPSGHVIVDERPQFGARPTLAQLRVSALDSLRALMPRPQPKSKSAREKEAKDTEPPTMSVDGISALSAAAAMVLLLVTLVIRPSRHGGTSLPFGLRLGVPLVGSAVGAGILLLDDAASRLLGSAPASFSVVVPTAIMALGSGFLLADSVKPGMARVAIAVAALCALGALVGIGLLALRLPLASLPATMSTLLVTFGLLWSVGASLGATVGGLLGASSRASDGAVGWTWGVFVAASALGTSVAQSVVHHFGASRAAIGSAVVLGLGALFATIGGLRSRPAS